MANDLSIRRVIGKFTGSFKTKMGLVVCAGILVLLTGCAGVTVTPLDATGKVASDQKEGLRYYMPMPYLLVVQLPQMATKESPAKDAADEPVTAAAGGGNPKAPSATNADQNASSQPSSAPISDTSFMASTAQYQVKLVYLPDFSHPMAMNESTGLFGTSSMKPVLQDGWMLTSLDASADSKTAETLTALASIAGTVAGGGAGAAAKTTKSATTTTQALLPQFGTGINPILRPGLYRFVYYDKTGVLKSLEPVVFFDAEKGTTPP